MAVIWRSTQAFVSLTRQYRCHRRGSVRDARVIHGPGKSTLVSGQAEALALINGSTAGQWRVSEGWAPIVGERAEHRVGIDFVGRVDQKAVTLSLARL